MARNFWGKDSTFQTVANVITTANAAYWFLAEAVYWFSGNPGGGAVPSTPALGLIEGMVIPSRIVLVCVLEMALAYAFGLLLLRIHLGSRGSYRIEVRLASLALCLMSSAVSLFNLSTVFMQTDFGSPRSWGHFGFLIVFMAAALALACIVLREHFLAHNLPDSWKPLAVMQSGCFFVIYVGALYGAGLLGTFGKP